MGTTKQYKVAICVPTLNEAENISKTTHKIDEGLKGILSPKDFVIVNADNASDDGTKECFQETITSCNKFSISTKSRGKGENLFRFLSWCKYQGIQYAATIDADISTLEADWAPKLISPQLDGSADYVCPVYLRNRFEGNTTNHFAMPLIFSFFGQILRQPIGGEFGFNIRAIETFLRQRRISEIHGYGVDIFFTVHAIGSGLKIKQVQLGKKLHKPSFSKIMPMFREVFISALYSINKYKPSQTSSKVETTDYIGGIDDILEFKHKEKLPQLKSQMLTDISSQEKSYLKLFDGDLIEDIISSGEIQASEWARVISHIIVTSNRTGANPKKLRKYADLIVPLFILRTITYLLNCENLSSAEVEEEISKQAQLIKQNILARL